MAEEGIITYVDGVAMLVTPDGREYRYSDVMRYNNPGSDFDDYTGAPLPVVPGASFPEGQAPRDNRFGDVAERYGNEELQTAKNLLGGSVNLYDALPESMQGGMMEPINRTIMDAVDIGAGILSGGYGLGQKGAAYLAEILASGTESEKRLARDMLGAFEGSGFGAEGRMLGSIAEAGGRAAAIRGVEDIPNTIREARLPRMTYGTAEAIPYAGVGTGVSERQVGVSGARHMPGLLNLSPDDARAFTEARSWVNPETGGDVLFETVGAQTLPTLRGQGVYRGPQGLEYNPNMIARSPDITTDQLMATESLRGLLDVQGGTPWTTLKGGDEPAIFIPHGENAGSVEEIEKIINAGKDFGVTDVVDVGEGYILRNFEGGTVDVSRKARKALKKATGKTPVSTRVGGAYPGYEGDWEKGAAEAIQQYLNYTQQADPAAVAALAESPAVRAAALERTKQNFKMKGDVGGTNPTVDKMISAVQRGGPESLAPMAEKIKSAEIPMQIPSLRLRPGEAIDATHFSQERRSILDPSAQFSNPEMRGSERALPEPYPAQTYFGVNVGQPGGYTPERGVGPVRHDVPLPSGEMLNIGAGFPEEVSALARQIIDQRVASGEYLPEGAIDNMLMSYMMQIAKQRGYTGLLNPAHELGSIATRFYPTELQ